MLAATQVSHVASASAQARAREVIHHDNVSIEVVSEMTAVDFPTLVRGVVLIEGAEKNPDPDVRKSVALATDPTQPEDVRLRHLRLVFFAPGNDARVWLTEFHANVRAAQRACSASLPHTRVARAISSTRRPAA